jgi:hypothetical protein
MSLWAEILLFVFLVLIMERLIGIQRTLAKLGSRLEEAIEDCRTQDSEAKQPEPRNEWIDYNPSPAQCGICGRSDGGHSVACTHYQGP